MVITTKFCTWHDSQAVMACAKICCNLTTKNWITVNWNFYQIQIGHEKSSMTRALVMESNLHVISWVGTIEIPHQRGFCFIDRNSSYVNRSADQKWEIRCYTTQERLLKAHWHVVTNEPAKYAHLLMYIHFLIVYQSFLWSNKDFIFIKLTHCVLVTP